MCKGIFSKGGRREDSKSHNRKSIQLMRIVNKEDKLLGRAANPQTGLVTPTEESVRSGGSNQNETRPKIDPVARQLGIWKRSKHGWHRVENTEQLGILQNGQFNEDLALRYLHERLDLVDPATPPTPPDSVSLTSHEGFRIQRKPLGSGSKQTSPTCAIVEQRHTDIQNGHRPINTEHQTSGGVIVAYPANLPYRPQPQARLPRTLHNTTGYLATPKRLSPDQANPGARIAANHAAKRPDNINQQNKPPLCTRSNNLDVLTGWNIPSPTSKPATAAVFNRHNAIHPHVQHPRHGVPIVPTGHSSKHSTKHIPAAATTTICKPPDQLKRIPVLPWIARSNVNQKKRPLELAVGGAVVHPSITTLAPTSPAPIRPAPPLPAQMTSLEAKKSCKVLIAEEVSLLLIQYNALRSLLQSPRIKWRPIAFLRYILHMLHHIVKTLVGPGSSNRGENDAGILERNSPADLFWCLVYSLVLFWAFRLLIPCIVCAARFIRVFANVVQWIV